MKLNIVTILLFTVLLTTGISTKSNAQHCGWHRYGYWAPEHSEAPHCGDYHGCWGGWRSAHCWGGYCTAEMRQHAIEDSTNCAKYHEDLKAAHAKYEEGDAIMRNSNHGCWGHGYCGHGCGHWDGGWWGGWRHSRYYYRGAGY